MAAQMCGLLTCKSVQVSDRGGTSTVRGGRGTTPKQTPKRRETNRAAQRRYRQKRRAAEDDRQRQLAQLTAESKQLIVVQGKAQQLAEENAVLRAMLAGATGGSTARACLCALVVVRIWKMLWLEPCWQKQIAIVPEH